MEVHFFSTHDLLKNEFEHHLPTGDAFWPKHAFVWEMTKRSTAADLPRDPSLRAV